MAQTVTVEISSDGTVQVQTAGFTGAACQKATAALEQALGVVVQDNKTPEFHQGSACRLPQQAKTNG